MHPSDFKRAKKRKTQPERGRSAAGHDGVDPDLRGDCLSGYYGEAGDVSAWPFYYRHDYFYGDSVRILYADASVPGEGDGGRAVPHPGAGAERADRSGEKTV